MFIPDPDFLPIPDSGSGGQKRIGSRISDPRHCFPHSLSSLFLLSSVSPTLSGEYSIYSYSVPASPFFPSNLASDQPVEPSNNHARYHLYNHKSIANQLGRLTTITVINRRNNHEIKFKQRDLLDNKISNTIQAESSTQSINN